MSRFDRIMDAFWAWHVRRVVRRGRKVARSLSREKFDAEAALIGKALRSVEVYLAATSPDP